MSVIKIKNLWKEYRLGVISHGTLTHDLQSWWAGIRGKDDPNSEIKQLLPGQEKQIKDQQFWALRDINLEVNQGDVLGIIGSNGAGKSTLLKVLSRVTAPSRGSIKVKGRIASLLEVGTGFHPELTGRENIFMNGAILGMSKYEIKLKLDEIICFSGVENFIDTPVKRYSSGMYVRLAFAVAAHLDPEILVIDEVLAVGDAEFQKKCLGRMSEISQQGRTILFVSHNLGAISRICSKSIVIGNGKIVFNGASEDGVAYYLTQTEKANKEIGRKYNGRAPIIFPEIEGKAGQILQLSLHGRSGDCSMVFKYTESITLHIDLVLRIIKKDYYMVLFVKDLYGNYVYVSADDDLQVPSLYSQKPGRFHYQVVLPSRILKPGNYTMGVSLTQHNKTGVAIDNQDSVLSFSIIDHESRRSTTVNGYRKAAIVAPEIVWELSDLSPSKND